MKPLFQYWHFNSGMMILVLVAAGFYLAVSKLKLRKGAVVFFSGLLLMALMESSPLHFLAMHHLFSAHMIIHVVILLIGAPLMVWGWPHGLPGIEKNKASFSRFASRYPWLCWLCGVGIMWFWHIPMIFNLSGNMHAGHSGLLPLLQPFSLMVAGMIFAWPLIGPVKECRVDPLHGILYLFMACMGCSLLGLLLTFAPAELFPHPEMAGVPGLSEFVGNQWSMTPQADQQISGLIMWVPCCFIYIAGSLFLLRLWFGEKEISAGQDKDDLLMTIGK
ncbi:MAG TPA: cytochrome c oxidase assembly protein [Edaphocola sp.]|nr:cytochrome c oxidase assembly protein [Edaphocola sp.]